MNYEIFHRHGGLPLWVGRADSRQEALAALAEEAELSAAEMRAAGEWAQVCVVDDYMMAHLLDDRLGPFIAEADAMVDGMEPLHTIKVADKLRAAKKPRVPVYYYAAEGTGGKQYQLAWQPAIRRLAVLRDGQVPIRYGSTLAEALASYLRSPSRRAPVEKAHEKADRMQREARVILRLRIRDR